jgi:hypothetical protein
VTFNALDPVELAEILEFLVGPLDTLVAPATIGPSCDSDDYDRNDLRADIARRVGRLLTSPLTPVTTSTSGSDIPELIILNRCDIDDIAHILGQLEDFLLHGDDQATLHLCRVLSDDEHREPQARRIGELGSYLRSRLIPRNS